MIELVGIGIKFRDRIDVIALALRFRAQRDSLLNRIVALLQRVLARRRPELVP